MIDLCANYYKRYIELLKDTVMNVISTNVSGIK